MYTITYLVPSLLIISHLASALPIDSDAVNSHQIAQAQKSKRDPQGNLLPQMLTGMLGCVSEGDLPNGQQPDGEPTDAPPHLCTEASPSPPNQLPSPPPPPKPSPEPSQIDPLSNGITPREIGSGPSIASRDINAAGLEFHEQVAQDQKS